MKTSLQEYTSKNKIRIVTATALFDGHDASINIMRRLLQDRGAEVIHLGHNRSAFEIAMTALQEDVQGVAISSYQGGHVEFFKYVREILDKNQATDVKIFGGGGGVIIPEEIALLERSGISKIFSPQDGQTIGLSGIIGHILKECDFDYKDFRKKSSYEMMNLARSLTLLENSQWKLDDLIKGLNRYSNNRSPVLGITGTGGAGKSSLTDELVSRLIFDNPQLKIGLICVDPTKRKTGGALLGDRIRFNTADKPNVFIRSIATRGSGEELASITSGAIELMHTSNFDLIIIETSGIGQGDAGILPLSDVSMYVMTSDFGAPTQLEKIDMLDYADLIAINKYERRQAPDALRDVRTLLRRTRYKGNHQPESTYPVFGTIANRFEDDGTNGLYRALCKKLNDHINSEKFKFSLNRKYSIESTNRQSIIPGDRIDYLSQIAKAVKTYHNNCHQQIQLVREAEAIDITRDVVGNSASAETKILLQEQSKKAWSKINASTIELIRSFEISQSRYKESIFRYQVRNKEVSIEARFQSLSSLSLPKVAVPNFYSKAEVVKFLSKENLPGYFPFTGGIFPFRRVGEDPKRQFAGEGGPEKTNRRFHYLCKNESSQRLSTAFDSVTLYGSDPDERPDIYGKIGESGVSVAHLNDMRALFAGIDLTSPTTSVSMTINGPAPIILAMFFNTAIDQQIDVFTSKHNRMPNEAELIKIHDETLQKVRGTVQADILKEDQAQNTCIFSIEFALKLMGDVQEYFIKQNIRNYYSVSVSGYHIAEAGANPITQLAFTLANGFTYVEYYLSRGMDINDIAPNLSFFFSNGLDPEYAVIGRVARRIWSIAMRDYYHASESGQKLKYHIQTSGRSLHAQEIEFNDIRTTLQALMALNDNCNSLHTNAYDEAITTPTEQSVRRAMAIQLIINYELGTNKCENINQGSFFIEEITDLVEEAVLNEFRRITDRGGVLGAMETQYQRNKIQEESLNYETMKDSGALPIIGVNSHRTEDSQQSLATNIALARSTYEEKSNQIEKLRKFVRKHDEQTTAEALKRLTSCVLQGGNIFQELMTTVRYASLGSICEALYQVGGKYRRSM